MTTSAALHSAASPEWGTPGLLRRFAAVVLLGNVDLDYASSAYFNSHWPNGITPKYLDGTPGKDVLKQEDRVAAMPRTGGTGFLNAPGLNGGKMVQKCWRAFDDDYQRGLLRSGVWQGFSLEQLASLQTDAGPHPLSPHFTTIIPSRRVRYWLHPDDLISILRNKQAKRNPVTQQKLIAAEQRQIDKLLARLAPGGLAAGDTSPVPGAAPPHASYTTILWSKDDATRARQMCAAREFLDAEAGNVGSLLQHVAIVGVQV